MVCAACCMPRVRCMLFEMRVRQEREAEMQQAMEGLRAEYLARYALNMQHVAHTTHMQRRTVGTPSTDLPW